ncbi:MAG: glycosyltransferase family 87 protein [Desulfomonilaceae bacterium]
MYFGYALADISRNVENSVSYMWDFRMYYFSAKAYAAGLNPYSLSDVQGMAGEKVLEFYYFPLSLHFFKLFTYLPYKEAARLFILIKFVLVIYLMFLWHRDFLGKSMDSLFVLFCLLAFNSAMYIDFRAGNVSIIEQAFMWSAFACFISRKLTSFGILLVVGAVFKALILVFAALILLSGGRDKYRAAAVTCTVLALIVIIEWLVDPELTKQFVSHALNIVDVPQDHGIVNPSVFSFLVDAGRALAQVFRIEVPLGAFRLIYVIWITTVAALSWKSFKRLDMTSEEQRKIAVYLACLFFALIAVRFKDYSFVLLLVPTYGLMLSANYVGSFVFLFILSALSAERIALPGLDVVVWFTWNYYPLFLACVVWIFYVSRPTATELDVHSKGIA